MALCQTLGAQTYINAIGGISAVCDRDVFQTQGVTLKFIRSRLFEYPQFGDPFVPWLSMVVMIMFNAAEQVSAVVRGCYELV